MISFTSKKYIATNSDPFAYLEWAIKNSYLDRIDGFEEFDHLYSDELIQDMQELFHLTKEQSIKVYNDWYIENQLWLDNIRFELS